MPLYGFFFFCFCFANFGLPLSINFIGEFLLVIGVAIYNPSLLLFIAISLFCSIVYSI
jgi:NADH:ubiquinone oxidoreductase subunit 4 (subunit M)